MNSEKTGSLLRKLRTEKGLTQAQVAERLLISDKAVSKWERGLGCPDISMLNDIAELFGVPVETLLDGEIVNGKIVGGNMKRVKFYFCTECGNIVTAASTAEISCCGRKLTPLEAVAADEGHTPKIEEIDGEFYVTFSHEMSKSHYITFVAYAGCDKVHLVKLYPEQEAALRIPRIGGGTLYFCCTKHGFMSVKL